MILVGEMRDLETVSTALTAAETGHLILSTLHTSDAAQAIHRIVDVFPPAQQTQIKQQLALSLNAIVVQHLIPRSDNKGRAVAVEVLLANHAVRNHIRNEKLQNLATEITLGKRQGMISLEDSLAHPRARRRHHAGGRAGAVVAAGRAGLAAARISGASMMRISVRAAGRSHDIGDGAHDVGELHRIEPRRRVAMRGERAPDPVQRQHRVRPPVAGAEDVPGTDERRGHPALAQEPLPFLAHGDVRLHHRRRLATDR